LELVERIEAAVRGMPSPTGTVSLTAFLPQPAGSGGLRGSIERTVFNRRLEGQRAELAASSPYLADTGEEELWRVTARLEGLTGQRYEEMLAELRQVVAPVLGAVRGQPEHGVSIVYTGMLPLLAESHSTVIRDLVASFSVSLLVIGVVLLIGLRSVRIGLLSILPNVFPIVLVFGTLGWLGRSIDVGTMMTASVGLGIAVDGTVHYLAWFMRGMHKGLSRHEAILHAYRHSAAAMLRTTAICGAGLAVFGMSTFMPAARFGWIVTALLLAALVGDLLLLPALLAGRLGAALFPDRQTEVVAEQQGG
jgi:predicted RND superfamily exporter protein